MIAGAIAAWEVGVTAPEQAGQCMEIRKRKEQR